MGAPQPMKMGTIASPRPIALKFSNSVHACRHQEDGPVNVVSKKPVRRSDSLIVAPTMIGHEDL
jgi:hypothetical protein